MTKKPAVRLVVSSLFAISVAIAARASALEGHMYYEQSGGPADGSIYERCVEFYPQIRSNFTSWNSQGAVVCSNYNIEYSHTFMTIGAPTCNGSTSQRVRIRASSTVLCAGPVTSWGSFSGCSTVRNSRRIWPNVTSCANRTFSATSWGT